MTSQVRKIRKYNDLSCAEVAKELGIHVNTYKNKENGLVEFKASEMFKLSRLFKLPIDQIFLIIDSEKFGIYKKGKGIIQSINGGK